MKQVTCDVGGGDDQCEDVVGALQKATLFDWKQQNRIIFLCADAPCHGTDYHDGCNDNHPRGLGVPIEPILHDLINKGVQIVFWKINGTTDKMISKFNQEASRCSSQKAFPGERPRNEYISTDKMNAISIGESMKASFIKSVTSGIATSSSRAKVKSIKHSVKKAAINLGSIAEVDAEAIAGMAEISLEDSKSVDGQRF